MQPVLVPYGQGLGKSPSPWLTTTDVATESAFHDQCSLWVLYRLLKPPTMDLTGALYLDMCPLLELV